MIEKILTVAIDPGLNGAIAHAYGKETPAVRTMPVKQIIVRERFRNTLDLSTIRATLRSLKTLYQPSEIRVFIERQAPRPTDGAIAGFQTGFGFGQLCGMMYGMSIPYCLVASVSWRAKLKMERTPDRFNRKADSVALAKRLFPTINLLATTKAHKPHDGMAEALLILEYGRRILEETHASEAGKIQPGDSEDY